MKILSYSLIIVLILILFLGCSKDDDFKLLDPEIVFVNSEGNEVLEVPCIDSNENFALQITLRSNGNGKLKTNKRIDYTVNGVLFSVTFTELGTKTIPINFIEGINVAQLLETGDSISLNVEFCNATIISNKISFVFADGSEIPTGECLDLNSNYAVKIETEKHGIGDIEPTEIEYTLNGVLYKMVFTEEGWKLNSINIFEGTNRVQIIGTDLEDTIHFVIQGDFELVE